MGAAGPVGVVIMARSPSDPRGKTRLLRQVDVGRAEPLRRALLLDTMDVVRSLEHTVPWLAFSPSRATAEMAEASDGAFHLLPQRPGSLGDRLIGVFDHLFLAGYAGVLIIGSDLPTLRVDFLRSALLTLAAEHDPIVLGPAEDGGYYLVGLRTPHPELFEEIPWGSDRVLSATLAVAESRQLQAILLPSWYDVDSPLDLRRVAADAGEVGKRTKAWVRAQEPT